MGIESTQPATARSNFVSKHRHCKDLHPLQWALSILLAPILPICSWNLLCWLLMGAKFPFDSVLLGLATQTMAWSLVSSATCLLILCRWHGRIRRTDCLLFGTALAFLLPFALLLMDMAALWIADRNPLTLIWTTYSHHDLGFIVGVGGLLLAPFGTLSGWILWRISGRFADANFVTVTASFD
jgi:hypothetical protein